MDIYFNLICVTMPLRPPWYINLFKPFQVLAGDSSSGPLGYFTFLYGRKKYNRGSGRKRTNEQNGLGSTQSARRVVLWHPAFLCICRLSPACIFREISTKLQGMPTHFWPSSSLPLDSTSRRLFSSAVHCQLPLRVSLHQPLSGFLY